MWNKRELETKRPILRTITVTTTRPVCDDNGFVCHPSGRLRVLCFVLFLTNHQTHTHTHIRCSVSRTLMILIKLAHTFSVQPLAFHRLRNIHPHTTQTRTYIYISPTIFFQVLLVLFSLSENIHTRYETHKHKHINTYTPKRYQLRVARAPKPNLALSLV